MILETVRMVADWLQDGTYGVNALRASIPQDSGVTAPPAVTVLDSTRDGRVGRGGVPALELTELPALLVSPADQPVEQQGAVIRPWPPAAVVTVLIRYVTSNKNTAAAERDTSQTIRAVWRAMGSLITQRTGTTRASVQLESIRGIQAATLYETAEDTIVTGGVLVTCHVRDTWAQS